MEAMQHIVYDYLGDKKVKFYNPDVHHDLAIPRTHIEDYDTVD